MTLYFVPALMTLMLFAPLFIGIYYKKKNMLTDKLVCYLILLSGVLLRIIYISYTDVGTRQHDVHDFFEHNSGHGEYITYLFENHALPNFDPRDKFQFYHPPLHHIICALWLTAAKLLGFSPETSGVGSLQYLTVIYSSLFALFSFKTLELFDLKPRTLQLCTAIVTFHPTLIIMSGSLNNDMLSSLFGMLSLYFTSKWARERKWSSIILTAFSIGLGMFTKLSVGLLAPGVAAVFLYILIKFRKEYKKLIPQFFVFGLICVPIGMFWSIRNLIKFDVPINYVPLLLKDSGQYIDKPPMERLLNWKPFQFMSPFTQWEWSGASYNEFNPVIALWKNAMFDEQTFFKKSITLQSFCTALFVCGIILSLLSVAGFVLMWIKNKNVKLHDKILLTGVALVVFGNYINFCIHFPHVCTENMRYCVPLIFVGAAVMGMMLDSGADSRNVIYKKINDYAKKVMTVFCGLSVFVYVMMMFYYHAVEK